MSFVPRDPDWRGLWADLLQGVGAGLLKLDGSRIARAALSGLDAFDDAQKRRRLGEAWQGNLPSDDSADGSTEELQAEIERAYPGLKLSPQEWASFWASDPSQQSNFLAEMARLHQAETSPAGSALRVPRPTLGVASVPALRPESANPFDKWSTGLALPLGLSAHLNHPTYRR